MLKPLQKSERWQECFVILSVVLIGILIYSNTFQAQFCNDDYHVIVDNPVIKNFKNLKALWEAFNTRLVTGFSFALNYHWGGFNPLGYHTVNLAIHILNSIFVFYFLSLTFKTPVLKTHSLAKHRLALTTSAALIFLCHPIQTEGVTFITQRAVSLATCFYLATLVFYIKGRLEKKDIYLVIAFLATFSAMLTKEMAATIPISLVIYEIFFFGHLRKEDGKRRLKILSPFLLTLPVIPLLMRLDVFYSLLQLKWQISHFDWQYFLTEVNVLRTYLRLLFLPVNQRLHYEYPLAKSLFEASTVFSLVLLGGLVMMAWYFFKKERLLSYSIVWFFVTTSVEALHVCFVHFGVLYEHWLYLPMVGFSIFFPTVLFKMLNHQRRFQLSMAVLIVPLSLLTFERNKVWQDEVTLWMDHLKKSPESEVIYFGLGFGYEKKGDYTKAIHYYKKSIELNPRYSKAYFHLGKLYQHMNRHHITIPK